MTTAFALANREFATAYPSATWPLSQSVTTALPIRPCVDPPT
eukprot:COSAG06_NODE_59182_length_275_cov_0.573864_2_plen_41_part_01